MAQQTINVGASPNDGTGTPLRTAFQYTNSNFTELYTATGPSGNNIVVPGTATITGDLTVDTNVLKVDTAGNRVIIGATTVPDTFLKTYTTDGTVGIGVGFSASAGYQGTWTNHPYVLAANGVEQLRIAPLGVFTFADGAGGTRMTLNSTGLGVGAASPAAKLDVAGNAALTGTSGFKYLYFNLATDTNSVRGAKIGKNYDSPFDLNIHATTAASGSSNEAAIKFFRNNTDVSMTLDSTGNLGIGVTPSAWATYKAVSVGGIGASVFGLGSSQAGVAQGAFFNNGAGSGWAYSATSQVPTYYLQINGENIWNIAASGTAGAQITAWTPAMKLDANGNLILQSSATPATLATNGQLTVNATSNTNLRFSYRGSDGTTRVANLTLA